MEELIVTYWRHMESDILAKIRSGNDLAPIGRHAITLTDVYSWFIMWRIGQSTKYLNLVWITEAAK